MSTLRHVRIFRLRNNNYYTIYDHSTLVTCAGMSKRTKCFIDFLPKLGVASVIISPSSPSYVSCSQNALTLCTADNSTEHFDFSMWSNMPRIDPSSATHCKYVASKGAVHVRFRLSTNDDLQTQQSGEDYTPSCLPDFERLSSSDLSCLLCGELILRSSSIHRVLPLPSFEWGDLSSEFFCHAHSHTPTTLPTPSPGDLLVGRDKMETRFSSLAAVLCDGIKLYCKRCKTHIGKLEDKDASTTADYGVATLMTHKIHFRDSVVFSATDISSSGTLTASTGMRSLETHLAAVLWRYSCDHHCYQFTVTSNSGQPYLQISSLNSTSWLLTNCHCSTTSSSFVGVSCDQSCDVEAYRVLKFLFKPLSSSTKIPQYQADALALPLSHCLTLLLLLMDSHTSLPPSLRTSVGMRLGYLRTSNCHRTMSN